MTDRPRGARLTHGWADEADSWRQALNEQPCGCSAVGWCAAHFAELLRELFRAGIDLRPTRQSDQPL